MTNDRENLSLSRTATGLVFWIHVAPRARRPSVGGIHDGALRVAVREPPAEGRANEACVRALARALGLPRKAVELDPASRSRRKRVRLTGSAEALETRLRALTATVQERPARGG